jgi:hypothetical protein
MGADASINMHKLNGRCFNYVTLSDCALSNSTANTLWKGINVATLSRLTTTNGTTFSGAARAINAQLGSTLSIDQTSISESTVGINIPNMEIGYTGGGNFVNLKIFSGNTIDHCDIGMQIANLGTPLDIGKNASSNNQFTTCRIGTNIINSNIILEHCYWGYNGTGVQINNSTQHKASTTLVGIGRFSGPTFEYNDNFGINCSGASQTLDVTEAKFLVGAATGISITGLDYGDFGIHENTFAQPTPAAYLQDGSFIYVGYSVGLNKPWIFNNLFFENAGWLSAIFLVDVNSISLNIYGNELEGSNSNGDWNGEPSTLLYIPINIHGDIDYTVFHGNILNTHGNSGYGPWPIVYSSAHNVKFEENILGCNSTTNDREGFRFVGAQNNELCTNTINSTNVGIKAVYDCSGTGMWTTTLNSIRSKGIWYSTWAKVPFLWHPGNIWTGSTSGYEAYIDPGLFFDPLGGVNTFFVRTDNYHPFCGKTDKYWPTAINIGFFLPNNTVYCPDDCYHLAIANKNHYLSDTVLRNGLSEGLLWDNDFYFYDYYTKYPDSLINADQTGLYDSLDNSNLPSFYYLESNIKNFQKLDTAINKHIDTLSQSYQAFSSVLYDTINDIVDNYPTRLDSNSNIDYLEDTLTTIQDSIYHIISELDSIRMVAIDSLFSYCSNIITYNSYDTLYKLYYYLLLKSIIHDTLNTTEYGQLYDISRLCPDDYGGLVFKANSLLTIDRLDDFSNNCSSPIILKSNNIDYNKTVSLMPNPLGETDNEIEIKSNWTIRSVIIMDIYGRILNSILTGNNSITRLSMNVGNSKLNSGIYIAKINLSNNISVKKLIFKI